MNEKTVSYTGISFASLLGLTFVVLKLCHVIDWSWWLVTLPFWIPVAIGICVLFIVSFLWYFIKRR